MAGVKDFKPDRDILSLAGKVIFITVAVDITSSQSSIQSANSFSHRWSGKPIRKGSCTTQPSSYLSQWPKRQAWRGRHCRDQKDEP